LVSFAVWLTLTCVLSGCERGWASNWVKTKKQTVTSIPASFGPAIDCPDGLGRCVGGVVEASRLARIPQPCSKTETLENCVCPWVAVADCPRGCAADGVPLVVTPDRAVARLCAQDPSNPVSRPAPAAVAPPGACDGEDRESYRCSTSLVLSCVGGGSGEGGKLISHVIAACLRGCARDGDSVGTDETDPGGASRILCAP
jgi:hypothetical protein